MTAPDLEARIIKAVADPVLAANVLRATDASTAHRREVVAERPDWEALRTRAAALRDHAIRHLDEHLASFVAQARRRGATVTVADTADEAAAMVRDLATARGARQILKSKSMTTEEVALNDCLEAASTTPLETDLGEYIVQLAGEPPSHITAPALHRSAEQIRDLFAENDVLEPDATPPEDHTELATWLSLEARRHLRTRLLDADLGVTGANFLVAETGTVVLVENEGNIRFTTTSPRVQVVVAGIDKVIPRLEDLATLLPLLTRSATGQRATSYVSLLSGGYAEQHVILLDGGRSALLRRAADREVLRCIRCGACMNVCPVYRTVGGHAYGSPYPGPIGALTTPLLGLTPDGERLPFLSSLCGACDEACPVRIPLHDHLLRLRHETVAEGRAGLPERIAFRLWRFAMGGRRRYAVAQRLARIAAGPARWLRRPRSWTADREAPRFAKQSFQTWWRERRKP